MNIRFVTKLMLLSLSLAAFATMADVDSYFMKLRGQKVGVIRGSVTTKGREGSIQVFDINHEIVSPRDPQSGLSTGLRQHKPYTVKIAI